MEGALRERSPLAPRTPPLSSLQVLNERGQVGFVPSNFVRRESLVDKAIGTLGFGKARAKASSNGVSLVSARALDRKLHSRRLRD